MRQAGWRWPEVAVRRLSRVVVASLAMLLAVLVGGCQWSSFPVVRVAILDAVWSSDGWIYYLREEASEGRQLWRQSPRQGSGELVLDQSAAESVCRGGTFHFLYRSSSGGLGVAVICDSSTRTELLNYSEGGRRLEPFISHPSVPFLGDAFFVDGESAGYAEVARECGMAVLPFVDGKLEESDFAMTVSGNSFRIGGVDVGCESVARARSPIVLDGKLFFLIPDSRGAASASSPKALDEVGWLLVQWDPEVRESTIIAKIPGIAHLATNGQDIVVAVHSKGEGVGVWSVDPVAGELSRIVDGGDSWHPSFSPSGKEFVYIEGLNRLEFDSLPA